MLKLWIGRMGGPRVLAAAAAVLALAVFLGRSQWPRYQRLRAQGVSAEAVVVGKDSGRSQLVHYTFLAGERLHSGSDRAGFGAPEFSELSVDDKVVVYYLPKDPDVSCLGDPREQLNEQNRAIILPLWALSAALYWALSRELAKASQ